MKRLAILGVALALTASGAAAQTPVQLKVGDMAPDSSLKAPTTRRTNCRISVASSGRARLVPESGDPRLHLRVQIARRERGQVKDVSDRVLYGERRSARGHRGIRQNHVSQTG
jgi:hypothetical protein